MDIIETQFSSATSYTLGSFGAIVFQSYTGAWYGMVEQETPYAYSSREDAVEGTKTGLRSVFFESEEGRLVYAEDKLWKIRVAIRDSVDNGKTDAEVIDQILAIME